MFNNEDLPSREEIEAERDPRVLYAWHDNAVDLFDNIKSQLEAWKLAGKVDASPDWSARAQIKAGFAGSTIRRIERQMVRLNVELPLTVDFDDRQRIVRLLRTIKRLRQVCAEAGLDVSDIK